MLLDGDCHELWALAQLSPGEGIRDGVSRIKKFLEKSCQLQTIDNASIVIHNIIVDSPSSHIKEPSASDAFNIMDILLDDLDGLVKKYRGKK